VKTIIVQGCDQDGIRNGSLITLVVRGDQTINETKAEKLEGVASPLTKATDKEIEQRFGCVPGYLGPLAEDIKIYADISAAELTNFTCGANINDKHIKDANWNAPSIADSKPHYDDVVDIRTVLEGDLSPDGKGTLSKQRGIEVGHIFQLEKKYSSSMNATALDKSGKAIVLSMGCYGIGVTRLIAACIEQKHDEQGIVWPANIAPFLIVIIQVDGHKSEQVIEVSEKLYNSAKELDIDVLLDDRDRKTSPGAKFADSELIGIPYRFVVSPRAIADGALEYKERSKNEKTLKPINECFQLINDIAKQR
jgi:prolyl-tRNA synthetase